MKGLLKWPLIVAALFVVGRVLLERSGDPGGVSKYVSVVLLYLLVFPLYFAVRISGSGVEHPYLRLLKATALYVTFARAMVIPTYWLAYIYQWPDPRFSVSQGGVVGPDVSPLTGFVLTPLIAAFFWIVGTVVIGGGLGMLVVFVRRWAGRTTLQSKT